MICMNKFEISVVFLFIIINIFSCGGFSDAKINLGEGYYYLGEGTPNNIIYKEDVNHNIEDIIIQANVNGFSFNDEYILVKQVPDTNAIKYNIMFLNSLSNEEADSVMKMNFEINRVLKNDTNYWIIDKKEHHIMGPYNKVDFIQKNKMLRISNKLIHAVSSSTDL